MGYAHEVKKICLWCRAPTTERWLCDKCVGEAVDKMSPDDLLRAAKVGMVALVDESTGYQQVRAKDELFNLYFKYLESKGLD